MFKPKSRTLNSVLQLFKVITGKDHESTTIARSHRALLDKTLRELDEDFQKIDEFLDVLTQEPVKEEPK